MSEQETWQCAYCSHYATVSVSQLNYTDKRTDRSYLAHDKYVLEIKSIICPNPKRKELTLTVQLGSLRFVEDSYQPITIRDWQLRPESSAKPFPDYIPEPIRKDYTEACLIQNLSANAAATLARRCLQGMVRDFYEVKKSSLQQEFEAIKDKVESDVWRAIDEVRKLGAIGAHMEKDVDVIVDVEAGEVAQLIWLIEFLFEEWFVAREERKRNLANIPGLAEKKKNGTSENPK